MFLLGKFYYSAFQISYVFFCIIQSAVNTFQCIFHFSYSFLSSYFLYFLILCWSSHCVCLFLSPSSVRIFVTIALNSLSYKLVICFTRAFSGVLPYSLAWHISLCFHILFSFICCLCELEWSSHLYRSWSGVLVWERPYTSCMCSVALVGELDLKHRLHLPLECSVIYYLGWDEGWSWKG